jgi:hypothetical protein
LQESELSEGVVVQAELIALKRFKDDVKKWPGMIVVSKLKDTMISKKEMC